MHVYVHTHTHSSQAESLGSHHVVVECQVFFRGSNKRSRDTILQPLLLLRKDLGILTMQPAIAIARPREYIQQVHAGMLSGSLQVAAEDCSFTSSSYCAFRVVKLFEIDSAILRFQETKLNTKEARMQLMRSQAAAWLLE